MRAGRVVVGLRIALIVLACTPSSALAHAVVTPATSTPGAYQRYVLQVPNERETPTTRVQIAFPEGVRVVSFGEVPGWELEILRDAQGAITGATWTGLLPAERFVELPFVAVNPQGIDLLTWPVTQMYGTELVEWTGPEDSDTPASTTALAAAASAPARLTLWLAGVALVLALLALGLALRRPGPAAPRAA